MATFGKIWATFYSNIWTIIIVVVIFGIFLSSIVVRSLALTSPVLAHAQCDQKKITKCL